MKLLKCWQEWSFLFKDFEYFTEEIKFQEMIEGHIEENTRERHWEKSEDKKQNEIQPIKKVNRIQALHHC